MYLQQSCSAIQYVRKTKKADKKLDDSIQLGLRWLISKIDAHWLELSKRIEIDVARKLKEEKREKEERTERVRRNRELRSVAHRVKSSLRFIYKQQDNALVLLSVAFVC